MGPFPEITAMAVWIGLGGLIALLVLAVVSDVRQRRIPNGLVLAGLAAGLAVHLWGGGGWGLLSALGGSLLLLGLTFPLFALGWLGAGDVKLLTAVGAFATWHYALAVLLAVGLAGGVVGSLAMIWGLGLGGWWQRIGALVGLSFAERRPPTLAPANGAGVEVPYAVAIALGTAGAIFLVRAFPVLVL